ncbi:MAG: hypothetical protein FWE14_00450 [Lachnospiraceae bacterium]|nr:hypothetical protein [Lachnospiraceae bacterium]
MKTIDPDCRYDDASVDSQVSRLLAGTISLDSHPTGKVKERALKIHRRDIISQFRNVIDIIPQGNDLLAVRALRDIIEKDTTLDNKNRRDFEKFLGITKDALLAQSEIWLADFFAGIMLYTAVTRTRLIEVQMCLHKINKSYIDSFADSKDMIIINRESFLSPSNKTTINKATTKKSTLSTKQILYKFKMSVNSIEELINRNPPIMTEDDIDNMNSFVKAISFSIYDKSYSKIDICKKIKKLSIVIEASSITFHMMMYAKFEAATIPDSIPKELHADYIKRMKPWSKLRSTGEYVPFNFERSKEAKKQKRYGMTLNRKCELY